MKVLIYEPHVEGHYFMFLKFLVPAIAALGVRPILLISQDSPTSEEFKEFLEPIGDLCQIIPCLEAIRPRSLVSLRDHLPAFWKSFRKYRPDHVYVPSADLILPWLGIFAAARLLKIPRGTEIECTVINSRVFYSAQGTGAREVVRNRIFRMGVAVAPAAIRVSVIDAVALGPAA